MTRFIFLSTFVYFFAVAHITHGQTPDSSYAVNAISANAILNTAYSMAQQADGATILGTSGWFELHKFTNTGFPDTVFGVGGRAFTVFDTGSYSNGKVCDIAIQPDGKIIAVGTATYCLPTACGVTYLMCARFLPNGIPDSTFGTFGYMRSDVLDFLYNSNA